MKSSSPQTTTTTANPPSFIAPYLSGAANQANYLYRTGGGISPITAQGNQMVYDRALAGSPVNNAAQDYASKTLSGGFMGANPYLDAAFNRAAGAVTNQVQSNFGLAGRNPRGVDAAGLASERYNDLAAQIYGGDYEAERARQQQLVPFSGQLQQQGYYDAAQLQNLGQSVSPATQLDDYIARLNQLGGGYGVTSSQTPTQRNALAGALGGASAGAAFGPWGMLGGAVLGGLYGG